MEISSSPGVFSRPLQAPSSSSSSSCSSSLARPGSSSSSSAWTPREWRPCASGIAHLVPLSADCAPRHRRNHVRPVLAAVSPFAGRDSIGSTDGSDDIASKLPALRDVLTLLRDKWRGQPPGGRERQSPGEVFLVGTGPGDPELLTLKALRLMQTADLVLYDRLVSTDILDMVHAAARLLYVGKAAGYHSRTQDEIHELLLNFAEAGATVLRLKGGDPLVFGRGGEEIDFLQRHGIKVTIVPGITAASGIAAELGIPLTLRDAASSVRFLTGHSKKGGTDPLYVAKEAADPDSTLVIYMGLATLPALSTKLMDNGLPTDTPSAAIERGTTAHRRLVFAKLEDLAAEVAAAQLLSPTLIIIGRVVALSHFWPYNASACMQKSNHGVHFSVKN